MRTRISVEDLRVKCIVGCLPAERLVEQEVRVDFWVEMDGAAAARSDALDDTADYAALSREVAFILRAGRFRLLESAGEVLIRWLMTPPVPPRTRPSVLGASIQLTKFGALVGQSLARVRVDAVPSDVLPRVVETKPWGSVDVVAETEHMGLYRLNIAAGHGIPNHIHRVMEEEELVLTDGLMGWADASPPLPLSAGAHHSWRLQQQHGYHNPMSTIASLLCIDRPRFQPADEVEIDPPWAGVAAPLAGSLG